ncbi:MAG: cytochrome c [Planctomycetes bacterium]|nr:cytochrome c [Planctomycetota bacterium]
MKITLTRITLAVMAALTVGFTSCRGGISHEPPVHIVLDMDFQPKVRAQSKVAFEGWKDHRGMRAPVSDPFGKTLVVAQGSLTDPKLNNRDANNAFVTKNPLPLEHKFWVRGQQVATIDRGRELFDIHCAICHGYSGQGGFREESHGLVGRRWTVAIPNFHRLDDPKADNRVANLADGEYFEVITHGVRTMPAYGPRLSVEERWSIVHYLRALQSLDK